MVHKIAKSHQKIHIIILNSVPNDVNPSVRKEKKEIKTIKVLGVIDSEILYYHFTFPMNDLSWLCQTVLYSAIYEISIIFQLAMCIIQANIIAQSTT